MAIADGELPPPPNGMSVDDLLWYCDWVGTRIPLHRLIEDYKGYVGASLAGFVSPQKVAGIFGMDYDENITEISDAIDTAKKYNVPVPFAHALNSMNFGI